MGLDVAVFPQSQCSEIVEFESRPSQSPSRVPIIFRSVATTVLILPLGKEGTEGR